LISGFRQANLDSTLRRLLYRNSYI